MLTSSIASIANPSTIGVWLCFVTVDMDQTKLFLATVRTIRLRLKSSHDRDDEPSKGIKDRFRTRPSSEFSKEASIVVSSFTLSIFMHFEGGVVTSILYGKCLWKMVLAPAPLVVTTGWIT